MNLDASTQVLVGDHCQLEPTVLSTEVSSTRASTFVFVPCIDGSFVVLMIDGC